LYNMERDPQLSKLFREGGVVRAPEQFTGKVMEMIASEPVKKVYKPLIGRTGRIMIILIMVAVVVLSLVYAEPGGSLLGSSELIPKLQWQMPKLNVNFNFLSNISLSTGLVSVLVALFILVLSDAGLSRRRVV
jgi:hypothetical protein